ncbi:hypothetical protein FQN54_001209 [Arachnomyces sp. PD_36]|nr:hypothetical protein FQN54_001209 [Arachnomyces sp. PD_36]
MAALKVTSALLRPLAVLYTVILCAVFYRYLALDARDPYKCGALMNEGRWSDESSIAPYNSDRFRYWNPPGCMLHDYGPKDLSSCLRHKKILFVGDSTVRQIFWAAARKLDRDGATREMFRANKHSDFTFERNQAVLEFVWDPFLNSSKLDHELAVLKDGRGVVTARGEFMLQRSMMVIGGGLWHARNFDDDYFDVFKGNLDHIVEEAESITKQHLIPPSLREEWQNPVLFAPVQVPNYEHLSPARSMTLLPSRIQRMNDYLTELSRDRGIEVVQSFNAMTQNQPYTYGESGLHVVENVADRRADILLNMRCNDEPSMDRYPYGKTCCASAPSFSILQLGLIVATILVPLMIVLSKAASGFGSHFQSKDISVLSITQPAIAFALVLFAVCCCYFTDRTRIFEKAQIIPSEQTFLIASGFILAAGFFFLHDSESAEDSAIHLTPPGRNDVSASPSFLPNIQADEWKGWMLAILLISNYTGASKSLWVYEITRLFVPAYLFISAFNHTEYLYQTGDYSVRRIGLVLVRLNLLNCFLLYVMKTNYAAYYYPFLLTFWFLVIYLTMRINHEQNKSTLFLFGKILVACACTSTLILVPGVLDSVVWFLGSVCNIDWDVDEFRHILALDMFIVYIGMIVGILSSDITSASNGPRDSILTRFICKYFVFLHILFVVASIILLPGYWIITRRSPNEEDYNWWQPYISFVPIVSFAILRSSLNSVRIVHSKLFAWLGRSFLEFYILHFHLWLVADKTGILRLGLFGDNWQPWGQLVETLLTTVYFIWISWGVSVATNTLVSKIVDIDVRQRPRIASLSRVDSNDGRGDLHPPRYYSASLPTSMKNLAMTIQKTGSGRLDGKAWMWRGGQESSSTEKALRLRLGLILFVMVVLNWAYDPLPSFFC